MTDPTIRLLNAAKSVARGKDGVERVIVRGDLDLECLLRECDNTHVGVLLIPPYQRELLLGDKHKGLKSTLKERDVPVLEYGLRGSAVKETEPGVFEAYGTVAIIDGLQRSYAARVLLQENERHLAEGRPDEVVNIRLGVTLHIGTTEPEEAILFDLCNFEQTTAKSNLLLRNMVGKKPGMTYLGRLVNGTPDFPLYGKVQWNQRMLPNELVSARTLVMVVATLYRYRSNDARVMAAKLDEVVEAVGSETFVGNIRYFFETVDQLWNIGKVTARVRGRSLVVKGEFLRAVAMLFAKYQNFWDGDKLFVNVVDMNALEGFLLDETVANAVKRAGGSTTVLRYLEECFSYAQRKKNRLVPREF